MTELNTGVITRTYTVNGGAEISFNPSDITFVGDVFDLLKKMEQLQQEPVPEDSEQIFAFARKRDQEMRKAIDTVFGAGTCQRIFGRTNVFSPSGGVPVCLNFIMAVMDEIETASEQATKLSPSIDAYVKKFEAKHGKNVRN